MNATDLCFTPATELATMIRTNPMELLDLPAEIPEEALAT